jgi:hypothetical protein
MTNKIKISEKDLYNIINESVYRILNEETDEGIFRDIKNGIITVERKYSQN